MRVRLYTMERPPARMHEVTVDDGQVVDYMGALWSMAPESQGRHLFVLE